MKTIVINDLHLGVQRTGGTTQGSLLALREFGHQQHAQLLDIADDGDTVLVNGDLSDVYDVSLVQAIEIYAVAAAFLEKRRHANLVWAVGNHDLSKDSSKLGTVAFLGALLEARFPDRFRLLTSPSSFAGGMYVIPHVANQDIFELELSRVPEGTRWLFLHCNYDNEFAMQADHSLNLSRDQAKALKARGITMIFGHEHQQRDLMGGNVVIVGNQFPTSIADCLGNDSKRCAVIEDGQLRFQQTWSRNAARGQYIELDWQEIAEFVDVPESFIRVQGEATAEQAADVVRAVSALRQRSAAFVITNAVQFEQVGGTEETASIVEDIRTVNVMEMLLDTLTDDQTAAVRALIAGQSSQQKQEESR